MCQRCARPICVECQTQAAVGVICPDCRREQRAAVPKRSPKSYFRVAGTGTPVVTYSLMAITAFVFLLQWLPGIDITSAFAFAPAYSFGEYAQSGQAPYEPWRMMTSVFTHSTGFIFHILLNMYTLWIFGQILESMLGRARFLTLYLASGLAGSVGVMFLSDHTTFVVGASGAIFGLLGAFLVIQRKLGGDTTQLLILVGINLLMGFLPGLNVAWQAHLGGLIGGVLLGLVFVQTRRPAQRRVQLAWTVTIVASLLALSFSHAPIFV
jgi:membrane associated rhomboid family serine protease